MYYVMRRRSTVGGAFNVLVTVTVTVTNRKPICDFLLVFHSNYILIFYGFLDITIYWLKKPACSPLLPTPSLKPSQRVFPSDLEYESRYEKVESLYGLPCSQNRVILKLLVLSQ